jgi:hypothetical protein
MPQRYGFLAIPARRRSGSNYFFVAKEMKEASLNKRTLIDVEPERTVLHSATGAAGLIIKNEANKCIFYITLIYKNQK